MIRSSLPRLHDIDTNIAVVADIMKGRSRRHLQNDTALLYVVLHALMIIAEAVRHLPEEALAAHPAIPWTEIVSVGDIIQHGYHRLDPDVLWNTVTAHLPALGGAIKTMLAEVDQAALPF